MKERTVDRNIVEWAKRQWPGMVVRKLSTLGSRGTTGDPDRLFVWSGKLMLIEMKAPGGKCTDLQIARHAEWRAAGATVVVVADATAGKLALDQFFNGRRRPSFRALV